MEFKITALHKGEKECHLVGYGVGTKEDAAKPESAFAENPKNSTLSLFLKKSAIEALGISVGSTLTLVAKPPEVTNGQPV